MAKISTNSGKINVSAGQNTVDVGITRDYSQYYSNLSKDWATKTNGLVNNEDYSSKYYAEKSKDWATNSENNLNSVISQHEQITSEITQAREDISTDLSGALLDIESNKTNSITEINTARDNGVNTVNSALENFDNTVETAQTDITNLKNFSVEEIKTEGAEQVDTIKKTGFYVQDGDLYCLDAEGKPKKLDTISDYSINNVHSFGDSKYVPTPVNNISWLKSEGQQNPKGSYPDVYDWILENINNGVEGFKRSTETYTDYDYVINTADETFRLPLLNGSEDLPSNTVIKALGTTTINATETHTLFTASHNGFVSLKGMGSGEGIGRTLIVFKNGHAVGCIGCDINSYDQGTVNFEVRRGDVVTVYLDYGSMTYNYEYLKAVGNGSLYYYVGETVQNVDLINAGRFGEELVDVKASIDGDWTYKQLQFASSVSIPINTEGAGNVFTYDLSNYLPNDGYKYEVTISVEVNNSSFCTLGYYLPDNSWYSFAKGGNPTGGCFTAIVDSSRQVKISIINTQEGLIWARAAAYRRLGKKV
nr:MAG TPA: hypothetical protein [Caudoviricetes sp.]